MTNKFKNRSNFLVITPHFLAKLVEKWYSYYVKNLKKEKLNMKNKKKSIFLASAILGSVALVSVGFASWVITSTPEPHAETGEIVVDTVEDKRISFVADSLHGLTIKTKLSMVEKLQRIQLLIHG